MENRNVLSGCDCNGCNCRQNANFMRNSQDNYGIGGNSLTNERQIRPGRYIYDQYGDPVVTILVNTPTKQSNLLSNPYDVNEIFD